LTGLRAPSRGTYRGRTADRSLGNGGKTSVAARRGRGGSHPRGWQPARDVPDLSRHPELVRNLALASEHVDRLVGRVAQERSSARW